MGRLVHEIYTFGNKVEKIEAEYIVKVQEKLAQYEDLEEQGRLIELKHGHWKEIGDYDGESHWQCSVCGVEWWYEAGTPLENQTHYCPKCGAKMDFEIELKEDEDE